MSPQFTRDTQAVARIANVSRALAIIELLCGQENGLTVTEIADLLGVTKGDVSRLTATMSDQLYITRDPLSNRFRLSLKLISLAAKHLDTLGIMRLCRPLLQDFADRTGELVQLALIEGDDIRHVARAQGENAVRVHLTTGTAVQLHAHAAGKIWLANLPREEALRKVTSAGLPRLTDRTITNVRALERELADIRARGYATNIDETIEGVSSVSAAVMSPRTPGVLVGAVTLSAPSYRLPTSRIQDIAVDLLPLGQQLADALVTSALTRSDRKESGSKRRAGNPATSASKRRVVLGSGQE